MLLLALLPLVVRPTAVQSWSDGKHFKKRTKYNQKGKLNAVLFSAQDKKPIWQPKMLLGSNKPTSARISLQPKRWKKKKTHLQSKVILPLWFRCGRLHLCSSSTWAGCSFCLLLQSHLEAGSGCERWTRSSWISLQAGPLKSPPLGIDTAAQATFIPLSRWSRAQHKHAIRGKNRECPASQNKTIS